MIGSPKRKAPPSFAQIAAANVELLPLLANLHGRSAVETCWACGASQEGGADVPLYKAHVLPHSRGGPTEPRNFFVLCCQCHAEQPDDRPVDYQLAWLAGHESEFARVYRHAQAIVVGMAALEAHRARKVAS